MTAEAETRAMTYAEYCAAERLADAKHEYLRGEVFAMTGGSPQHGALAVRIGSILTRELSGRPCRVFSSDVRVRIDATDLDTYPDLSVVCGALETATGDANAVTNPVLLVEVLSDSTEAYDRGQKASHYRRIPSLRAYLLVSQHEPRLELQARREDGSWVLREAGPGEELMVEGLDVRISVDEVYDDPLAASEPS